MNNEKTTLAFKGISGPHLEPVNQLLAEFCQLVAAKGIYINCTSLIENVLRPQKKVDPKMVPFMKMNEPNTVELHEFMEELEVRTTMPQQNLAKIMLESVDAAAWTNANPHAYALAAYANALVDAFSVTGTRISDDEMFWNSLEDGVEGCRPQE